MYGVFCDFHSYITVASAPINALPEVLLSVIRTIFFPSHWLRSALTPPSKQQATTTDEREMNPVTMAIINSHKDIGQAVDIN